MGIQLGTFPFGLEKTDTPVPRQTSQSADHLGLDAQGSLQDKQTPFLCFPPGRRAA